MTHYLKSKDGNFKFKVEMGCGHKDMVGNSTSSVGCDGNCQECSSSVATLSIPDVMELIRRADCNYRA